MPKRFGGEEWSPRQFCELIETLSKADGSVGWVASFGMSPAYLGSLPEETLKELYQNGPDVVFAEVFSRRSLPKLPMKVWWCADVGNFQAAVWALTLLVWEFHLKNNEMQGLPRMAVMPANKAKIEMTWDTVGLKGTGSHDLVVEDVLVEKKWTFVRGEPSKLSEPFLNIHHCL